MITLEDINSQIAKIKQKKPHKQIVEYRKLILDVENTIENIMDNPVCYSDEESDRLEESSILDDVMAAIGKLKSFWKHHRIIQEKIDILMEYRMEHPTPIRKRINYNTKNNQGEILALIELLEASTLIVKGQFRRGGDIASNCFTNQGQEIDIHSMNKEKSANYEKNKKTYINYIMEQLEIGHALLTPGD